jgi:SAM-dependent methyltransferase
MNDQSNGTATRYKLEGQIVKKRKRALGWLLTVTLRQECQDDDDNVKQARILVDQEEAKPLCYIGAIIRVHGYEIVLDDYSNDDAEQFPPLMRAIEIHLLRCAPDPKAVDYVLTSNAMFMSLATVLGGDRCTDVERIRTLVSLPLNSRERRLEIAKQVRILGECSSLEKTPRKRTPHVKRADLQLLQDMERQITFYPLHKERAADCETSNKSLFLINVPNNGDPELVSSRGKMTRCDYYHGRKQPQVQWMVDRLKEVFTQTAYKHILDVGGGRGDLATAIALEFPNALVTVIDRNAQSLQAGREYSQKVLGRDNNNNNNNIRFVEADFLSFTRNNKDARPDVVVALHACGDLTDAVLDYVWVEQIPFLICPCCYNKKLVGSFVPAWHRYYAKDGQTTRATLERLAESEVRSVSLRAATLINSMRLGASVQQKHDQEADMDGNSSSATHGWSLSLEQFPSKYSLRNIVLVGKRSIT